MSEQDNTTTQLLVEIPRDLQDITKEILTFDFKNGPMACWILGRRRNEGRLEIITLYEIVVPPTFQDESNESKIKVNDIVGTVLSTQTKIPMKVEKTLTKQKHIRLTINAMTKQIEIQQVKIKRNIHPSKSVDKDELNKQTLQVITQKINIDTILTDCRPLTESFRHSMSSLGDPFKPKQFLRELSANTYTRLSSKQIAKIHINKNANAKVHFENVNPQRSLNEDEEKIDCSNKFVPHRQTNKH